MQIHKKIHDISFDYRAFSNPKYCYFNHYKKITKAAIKRLKKQKNCKSLKKLLMQTKSGMQKQLCSIYISWIAKHTMEIFLF